VRGPVSDAALIPISRFAAVLVIITHLPTSSSPLIRTAVCCRQLMHSIQICIRRNPIVIEMKSSGFRLPSVRRRSDPQHAVHTGTRCSAKRSRNHPFASWHTRSLGNIARGCPKSRSPSNRASRCMPPSEVKNHGTARATRTSAALSRHSFARPNGSEADSRSWAVTRGPATAQMTPFERRPRPTLIAGGGRTHDDVAADDSKKKRSYFQRFASTACIRRGLRYPRPRAWTQTSTYDSVFFRCTGARLTFVTRVAFRKLLHYGFGTEAEPVLQKPLTGSNTIV
jgi:hypothetical protein